MVLPKFLPNKAKLNLPEVDYSFRIEAAIPENAGYGNFLYLVSSLLKPGNKQYLL